MKALGWVLIAIIVVLILLPPEYDPAIRLSQWVHDRKKR